MSKYKWNVRGIYSRKKLKVNIEKYPSASTMEEKIK